MEESSSQEATPEAMFVDLEPRQALAKARRWARARCVQLICAALLGVMSLQMLAAASRKSISTDEVVHIPAGYYHLVGGDFQFLNLHPPVPMMIGALALLLLAYAFHVYVSGPSLRRALWLGGATGLAPLMKFSMVAVAPLAILGVVVLLAFPSRLKLNRKVAFAHAAAIVSTSLLVINVGYFFDHRPFTEADNNWIVTAFPSHTARALKGAHFLRYIAPTDFLLGTYWHIWHSSVGHDGSIFGQQGRFGWWYYFPAAFALKTTIPFLLTSVAAIIWGLWRELKQHDRIPLFVLIPFLLFTALVMESTINIGVRFYLPAYSFLFIISGALLDRLSRIRTHKLLGVSVVFVVLVWCAAEMLRTYPDYIPYMNQLAFSRPYWAPGRWAATA